jgi:glycosyltransferase involved in cell wall biosynthesis
MASGCVVVASDTAPVREVIVDGHNGLLVDFFDHHAIAKRIARVLDSVDEYDCLRRAAKLTASRFDVEYGTKQYFEVFENVTSGYLKKQPAPQFGREV